MGRYTKLGENFYALDLYYGKTNSKPNRNFHCFFIVENPCSDDFIREQALALLTSQCTNFDFYGSYSSNWDIGFDLLDAQLHPEDDSEVALTSNWVDFDDFVDALETAISTRYFVPCDIYLIYDDVAIYQKVLKRIEPYVTQSKTPICRLLQSQTQRRRAKQYKQAAALQGRGRCFAFRSTNTLWDIMSR